MILIGYNLHISKTVKSLSNTREMVANLQVLQDFMDIVGREIPVRDKIELINNILIEKYNIKYSTIVVFNGAEYILKASNVDKRFWKEKEVLLERAEWQFVQLLLSFSCVRTI